MPLWKSDYATALASAVAIARGQAMSRLARADPQLRHDGQNQPRSAFAKIIPVSEVSLDLVKGLAPTLANALLGK